MHAHAYFFSTSTFQGTGTGAKIMDWSLITGRGGGEVINDQFLILERTLRINVHRESRT